MLHFHKYFKGASHWFKLAIFLVGVLSLTILPTKSASRALLLTPAKGFASNQVNEQRIEGKVASPINLPVASPDSENSLRISYPPALKPTPISTYLVEFPKTSYPITRQAISSEKIGSEPVETEEEAEVILDRIRWFKERHPELRPRQKLEMVREEYQEREAEKTRAAKGAKSALATATNWVSLGPTNGAGRVSSVAVHPTAIGTVYIGADGGGVWKTTDSGNTWTNLTDSINNLNVGAIALAPSSPNIIYLGTGSEHSSGIGLLKSTDGGNTWQFPSSVIAGRFWRISVHPTNPLELVAATDEGALRSVDGGQSWTTVLSLNPWNWVTDVKRDPVNPLILYSTGSTNGYSNGGVLYKSVNGGITWTKKTSGLPSNADFMSIAISPSNPLILYVLTSIQGDISHVYKSTNGGESWADLPGVSGSSNYSVSHVLGNQAWHDNAIVVSPSNSNVILAMGVYEIRSSDGGVTWANPPFTRDDSPHCETNVHADTTDLQYQGANLYIVGDGGIFSTPDDGNTAFDHNNGLVIREYYAISNANPVFRSMFFGGSQDNGTDRRSAAGGAALTKVMGSDGFDSAINTITPSIAYATVQYGSIFRTKQAGTVDQCYFEDQHIGPELPAGESGPFFTRLIMDFKNPSTLYTLTNLRVWRTTDSGNTWSPLPTTTTDGSTWAPPSRLSVSRSNSNVLMTSNGLDIFRSGDGGTSWVKRTPPNYPDSLEIDPKDPNTAYVGSYVCNGCIPGFFMTDDGGVTWTPGGNGLPQGAVLVIRVDPLNSNKLYCGTYNGVYTSTDRGANWSKIGIGLPSINVEDLRVTDDGALLRAATYGRGVWEVQLQPTSPIGISGKLVDGAGNPIAGATLSLSLDGSIAATTQSDSTGKYAFSDLAGGHNYTVTPSKLQYTFGPHSASFNNFSSTQTATFTGTQTNATYKISGKITAPDGNPITGILVWMGPAYSYLTSGLYTDGSGNYSFGNVVAGGDYKIQPDNQKFPPPDSNYSFSPNLSTFLSLDSNQTANFVASDPFGPSATAATNVTASSFTANWTGVNTATGYRLDVSADSFFNSYLTGYQDLDVGNSLSRSVTGLSNGVTYYYRVRAYKAGTTSSNSGTISVKAGSPNVQVTVQSNPTGRSFTVDGTGYSTTQAFSWTPGSSHTIGTTSPQSGGSGTQYVWSSWSGGGGISHTVSPDASATYTANFTTQYLLTTSAAAGGTVSPPSAYFNNGQSVNISASANSGYTFADWSGSGPGAYTGTNNPAAVTMNGPITEEANFTANPTPTPTPTPNQIDSSPFFVTQHYQDFLGREPDASGISFWTNEIESCGQNQQCREVKRINVSAAFFLSIEFQNTGYLVERMYKVAYGDRTEASTGLVVPSIRRSEFMTDTPLLSSGVIVGQGAWEATLEANKVAYALTFVQRQRFTDIYGPLDATQFVDRLNLNAGGVLTNAERASLISEASAGTLAARASVLRKVAENAELDRREKNRAFVLMEYFGYLRRNPNDAPEAGLNFAGWNFWLGKLNEFNGDFIAAEMVKAFISSDEYRHRFGQ